MTTPANPAIAAPVFMKSQMPRMHCQNLLTGQWLHRDVQGVTSPSVTWMLNGADTFTCNLGPPRPDLLDATGNPVLQEWRDAIYLEESDQIRFGGILTSSTMTGPQWSLTATGFAGYPNGTVYEGPNASYYNIDALDAVRYLWGWMQAQPGGDLQMQLGTQKAGTLLGSYVAPGSSTALARDAGAGDKTVWLGGAAAFQNGAAILIGDQPYQIATIATNDQGTATGEVTLTSALKERHYAGELVISRKPSATLARDAASGQPYIWLSNAAAFTSGMVIFIGSNPYTISSVTTDSAGKPTGQVVLTGSLYQAHSEGEAVTQAPTDPWQMLWYNSTDIGQEIQSIQAEAVFDWREQHTWTDAAKTSVLHQLQFGVPRLGVRQTGLRFCEGENIVQPGTVTHDGTAYANTVIGLGAGTGSVQIRSTVSNANTGRLRRVSVYTDQTALTTARMSAGAQRVLAATQNIDAITSVTVKNHPNAPFGSFSPGDDIPVQLCTGWRNGLIWSRITQAQQDPTTSLMTLTLARSDSFSYLAQSGQAGTI